MDSPRLHFCDIWADRPGSADLPRPFIFLKISRGSPGHRGGGSAPMGTPSASYAALWREARCRLPASNAALAVQEPLSPSARFAWPNRLRTSRGASTAAGSPPFLRRQEGLGPTLDKSRRDAGEGREGSWCERAAWPPPGTAPTLAGVVLGVRVVASLPAAPGAGQLFRISARAARIGSICVKVRVRAGTGSACSPASRSCQTSSPLRRSSAPCGWSCG